MKIKVSEATPVQLDWMVAIAKGVKQEDILVWGSGKHCRIYRRHRDKDGKLDGRYQTGPEFRYSSLWEAGGPIIERERLSPQWNELWKQWSIPDRRNAAFSFMGDTLLIAAMRCFAASRLGEEVDVPEELCR